MTCILGYVTSRLLCESHVFKTMSVARRRIGKLVKLGIINIYPRTLAGYSENLLYPNYDVAKTLISKDLIPKLEKTLHLKPWKSANSRHEDILRRWALIIKACFKDVEINLDFMLYNSKSNSAKQPSALRSRLPDMIVQFTENRFVNFEIELTQKSSARYFSRLRALMFQSNNPTIYLTDNSSIRNAVHETVELLSMKFGTVEPKPAKRVHCYLFDELPNHQTLKAAVGKILSNGVTRDLPHGEASRESGKNEEAQIRMAQ